MFFETSDGDLVPISRISEISFLKKDGRAEIWRANLTDETTVEISGYTTAILRNIPLSAFAALPNTNVLTIGEFDGRAAISSEIALGWAVLANGLIAPVTREGIVDGLQCNYYVQMPDDSVVGENESWTSYSEFRRANGVVDAVIHLPEDFLMDQ